MRRKYGLRIAGFVLKGLCTAFILSIVALLAWRIIDRDLDPKVIKTVTPNDTLCAVYAEYGKNMTVFCQEQNEYTQESHNYGYFANGGTRIFKEAEQIQFVLRYNNSTLEHTAVDYARYKVTDRSGAAQIFKTHDEALEAARKIDFSAPDGYIEKILPTIAREDNVYDVTITVMYDLTPENTEDNDGKTPEAVRYQRFHATGDVVSFQKTLYNYRKFTFDGIQIDDSVLAIYADVYYAEELDYEKDPYGTLLLYYYADEDVPCKLTHADKKALEDFGNNE